jgi:phosphomannomutase
LAARWACEVFAAGGVHVKLIDRQAPTPLIMFVVKKTGAQYGMAITASHNPAEYNGVKLFTAGGRDATEEVTSDLEAEIAKISPDEIERMDFDRALEGGMVEIIAPQNEYVDSILSVLNTGAIKERRLRVLLDPMHGVSRTSLSTVLLTCRCDVDVINDRHDALFGGRLPAPTAQTLRHLSQAVTEGHYDLASAPTATPTASGSSTRTASLSSNDILVLRTIIW